MSKKSNRAASKPAMKTFAGHRNYGQIKAACKAQGLAFEDNNWVRNGSDYIRVLGGGGWVLYNTFNGTFFGETDRGVKFYSSETKHESEPWFQALLSFFYVEKS